MKINANRFRNLTSQDFHAAIIAERPDLAHVTPEIPRLGYFGYVMILGDEVFKAPRGGRDSLAVLLREKAVLTVARDNNIPYVPHLTYASRAGWFIGMTRTPGVPVSALYDDAESGAGRKAISRSLAAGVAAVQAVIDERLGQNAIFRAMPDIPQWLHGLRHMTLVEEWDGKAVRKTLAALPDHLRTRLDDYVWRCQKRDGFYVHGDLKAGNVMVDPDTKEITGFIDVSFSYAHRAVEIAFDNAGCLLDREDRTASFNVYAARTPAAAKVMAGDIEDYRAIEILHAAGGKHGINPRGMARKLAAHYGEKMPSRGFRLWW